MHDPIHLNASAEQCSAPVLVRGQRIVWYQGEEYTMVGLYFGSGQKSGPRELFYILRFTSNGQKTQR